MQLPTIHMNGTPRSRLLDEACDITRALRAARDEMQSKGPNARDYYPQGDSAFEVARDEHVARLNSIDALIKEYEKIAEHISDAS